MASTTVDRPATDEPCLGDKAAEAYRKATHLAHEARVLKNLASDAVEDGVYAARRAINRGIESAADVRDTAVYRVKRHPLKAIGLAFGAGILLGAAIGWAGRRRRE